MYTSSSHQDLLLCQKHYKTPLGILDNYSPVHLMSQYQYRNLVFPDHRIRIAKTHLPTWLRNKQQQLNAFEVQCQIPAEWHQDMHILPDNNVQQLAMLTMSSTPWTDLPLDKALASFEPPAPIVLEPTPMS